MIDDKKKAITEEEALEKILEFMSVVAKSMQALAFQAKRRNAILTNMLDAIDSIEEGFSVESREKDAENK